MNHSKTSALSCPKIGLTQKRVKCIHQMILQVRLITALN